MNSVGYCSVRSILINLLKTFAYFHTVFEHALFAQGFCITHTFWKIHQILWTRGSYLQVRMCLGSTTQNHRNDFGSGTILTKLIIFRATGIAFMKICSDSCWHLLEKKDGNYHKSILHLITLTCFWCPVSKEGSPLMWKRPLGSFSSFSWITFWLFDSKRDSSDPRNWDWSQAYSNVLVREPKMKTYFSNVLSLFKIKLTMLDLDNLTGNLPYFGAHKSTCAEKWNFLSFVTFAQSRVRARCAKAVHKTLLQKTIITQHRLSWERGKWCMLMTVFLILHWRKKLKFAFGKYCWVWLANFYCFMAHVSNAFK